MDGGGAARAAGKGPVRGPKWALLGPRGEPPGPEQCTFLPPPLSGAQVSDAVPTSFQCSCLERGAHCDVIYYSVAADAVSATASGSPCSGFLSRGGERCQPTARSVITTYYGRANEKSPRMQTARGDGAQAQSYYEVQTAAPSRPFFENSVLLIPDLVSRAECHSLIEVADRHASVTSVDSSSSFAGTCLHRLPVCELGLEAEALSFNILRDRVLHFFELNLPEAAESLFGQRSNLGRLAFSHSRAEPAVNRYTAGGEFSIHHDAHSVTVNVLLSEPDAFLGGGTAFWPQGRGSSADGAEVVLQPPRGVGVVFNGHVEHAGRPVLSGVRHVFVSSFNLVRE
ncbi:unnamed protein product [Prorocentrum cordatum]|uniref:Fe2OG dioxygenase domain-containing protein n=1 Tax=Prorocentrum cordatum TaxID=2364126 RepID=A0ABN9WLC1_9DINO|nr:unnamed protein product [Polarella glacialis]